MSALEDARLALVNGELNAEMGVPVSWSEVRALHDVIRGLIADRRQVRADAWDEGYRKGALDGYFETRDEKNPYRAEVSP